MAARWRCAGVVSVVAASVACSSAVAPGSIPAHDATSDVGHADAVDATDALDAMDSSDVADAIDGEAGCDIRVRLIAPLSTAHVTSRRPTLRIANLAASGSTRIEMCRDRAFTQRIESIDVTDPNTIRPSMDLPPGVVFWRAHAACESGSGSGTSPTWEFTVPARSGAGDYSWGSVLDVNGDGYADALTLAPFMPSAWLYLGGPAGIDPTHAIHLGASERGENAGDVNGDGYGDVLLYQGGAPPGVVRLYFGGPDGLRFERSVPIDGDSLEFGIAFAGVGDVNADGYADILVGAPSSISGAPSDDRAYVFPGGPAGPGAPTVLHGTHDSRFGDVVAGGDFDGDGRSDLAVTEGTGGGVVVFRGTVDLAMLTPFVRIARPGSQYGRPLACVGDLDQDGFQDLLMGSSFDGSFQLLRGGATGIDPTRVVYLSVSGGEAIEPSSIAADDTNGDGVPDLLVAVTAGGSSDPGGRLAEILGGPAIAHALPFEIAAPSMSAQGFAWAVGAGDFDGDGFADAVAGAYGENASYVYRGGATGLGTVPVARVAGGTR